MCSVVGYIGDGTCRGYILEGLRRLEYRGYDSAGFASLGKETGVLSSRKAVGKLENLVYQLADMPVDENIGIGHTRWSTHGAVTQLNAHPQFDCTGTVAVVHNGIIENYLHLRKKLEERGHRFISTTDTEVIAHLFEDISEQYSSLNELVLQLVNNMQGAYACLVIAEKFTSTIVAIRKKSPLCIGRSVDGLFVASDQLAFAGYAQEVAFMPDESFVTLSKNGDIEAFDFSGEKITLNFNPMQVTWAESGRAGHEHFMLKEIYEQKTAIGATLQSLREIGDNIWQQLGIDQSAVEQIDGINLIGCGSSWHAAAIATYFFEEIAHIPATASLASEFRYKRFFPDKKALYIGISQSGETADTLEALRMVRDHGMHTLVISNVQSSTMVRESPGFLLTQAGYEMSVISTKAFATQLSVAYWLACRIAREKNILSSSEFVRAEENLLHVAQVLELAIDTYAREITDSLAREYATCKYMVFLGRHESYYFAQEAALKAKETAYIWAISYSAGELKHGPLALIDEATPVFVFACQDPLIYQKLLSNVQEVKSRGGHITAFVFDSQQELKDLADRIFVLPDVPCLLGPLAMTGLMQFLVYHIAKELDLPIDKPRNLAKSVTVE